MGNCRFGSLALAFLLTVFFQQAQGQETDNDRGMLGIGLAEKKDLKVLPPPARAAVVYARSVLPGSAADKGGIQVNDIIIKFNNSLIQNVSELQALAAETPPGTKVTLIVLRNDKPETLSITMGSRKEFEQTSTSSFIGKPAPELIGTDIRTGQTQRLSSFKGRPVIVELWATWCPTCRTSIPRLNALLARHKEKNLKIIGVSSEDQAVLKKFHQHSRVDYLSLRVDESALHQAYWTNSIPTFIYIDAAGLIQTAGAGENVLTTIEKNLSK